MIKDLTINWEFTPNNIVEVFYTYSHDSGTHSQPPFTDIIINKMELNRDDVTELFQIHEDEIIELINQQKQWNE